MTGSFVTVIRGDAPVTVDDARLLIRRLAEHAGAMRGSTEPRITKKSCRKLGRGRMIMGRLRLSGARRWHRHGAGAGGRPACGHVQGRGPAG